MLVSLIAGIVSFFKVGGGIVKLLWTIVRYMEMVKCDYRYSNKTMY